jgi:hypothetical protein
MKLGVNSNNQNRNRIKMNSSKEFKNVKNQKRNFIIFGACILFVALLIFLVVFTLNKSKKTDEKTGVLEEDWAENVAWYGADTYQIYEENGKSVIYHLDTGFKFFIPTDWNWNVSLGNYWAYTSSPDTVFQDDTSLLTGCYILISAFVGEDFYSNLTGKIEQVKESPLGFKESFEIIKIAGTEGLYTKNPEGFNLSIINVPLNQSTVLRIKIFYPTEKEDREKCDNAFLEIINGAERV